MRRVHALAHMVDFSKLCSEDASREHNSIDDFLRAEVINMCGANLRSGDMIIDVSNPAYGYRSCGLWFYYVGADNKQNNASDNKQNGRIIRCNKKFDDYGSLPSEFNIFEFPAGYWELPRDMVSGSLTMSRENREVLLLPPWINDHCGYFDPIDGASLKQKMFPYWHGTWTWAPISLDNIEEIKSVDNFHHSGDNFHRYVYDHKGGRRYLIITTDELSLHEIIYVRSLYEEELSDENTHTRGCYIIEARELHIPTENIYLQWPL